MPIDSITNLLRIHDAVTQEELNRRLIQMFEQLNDRLSDISDSIDGIPEDGSDSIATLEARLDARIGTLHFHTHEDLVDADYELILNGQTVNRADWPELWAKINDAGVVATEASKTAGQWGDGDGVDTFSLPDYTTSSRFIRMSDTGGGTLQDENIGKHRHDIWNNTSGNTTTGGSATRVVNAGATVHDADGQTRYYDSGDSENRPINVTVIPCVWGK